MAGREGPPRSSFRTIAVLTLIPVAALFLYLIYTLIPRTAPLQAAPPRRAPSTKQMSLAQRAPRGPSPRVSGERVALTPSEARGKGRVRGRATRGQILLIIDDIGFEGQPLEEAMSIDPDINFSVLPNSSRAREYARRLHARGFEVLCHLPMEPMGDESPGRNAILTSMSDAEIADTVRAHLEAVPHARGVNNHMGSRATADRRVMTGVLGALPEKMYFIDSRTGGRSVAASVARSMNIRTAVRHVFLDDTPHRNSVRQQLTLLAQQAEKHGVAVGIAHPHASTLRVLREEVPRLRAEGFRFVRGSEAVN
jgi:polysaccharide deacetylase 2 family uncharacterized protein YibQ